MTDVRLRVRPAREDEAGHPLVDFVHERVGTRRGQRVIAFVQGWGVLADELARVPTVEEYAARFQVPIATAYREQATFREAFPSETTPDRVLKLLWDELTRQGRRHLLSTPVLVDVDGAPDHSPVLGWFAATLLERLPTGAATAVDRAMPPLSSSAGPRRAEVARAYGLVDRAVFEWAAAVLGSADPALLDALASLERLAPFDEQPAAYAAAMLREYLASVGGDARAACEEAAGAADAVALLGLRPKAADDETLATVGRRAAATLADAFASAAVRDVVTPARDAVLELVGERRARN